MSTETKMLGASSAITGTLMTGFSGEMTVMKWPCTWLRSTDTRALPAMGVFTTMVAVSPALRTLLSGCRVMLAPSSTAQGNSSPPTT